MPRHTEVLPHAHQPAGLQSTENQEYRSVIPGVYL